MSQTLLPPPGWYPDPADPRAQRWWDGAVWSSHVVFPAEASAVTTASTVGPTSSVVAPPQGRWGLGDVGWTALVVVAMFGVGIVAFVLLAFVSPDAIVGSTIQYDQPPVAWTVLGTQLLVMAGLAGWPLIAARSKGNGWRRSFGFTVNGRALLFGAVGGVVTFIVLLTLTALSSVVFGQEVDSAAAEVVDGIADVTVVYVIFLAIIALGAPFVEEIAFRGLLWGALVKRGHSPWIATAISAVAFGAFHFEPLRLVALIAAGFVLGIVRHYAGLAASMVSHAVVNTIGVLALLATS